MNTAVGILASLLKRPETTALAACLLFALNLHIWYPGKLNPDSQWQYWQAYDHDYSDWHPPIMARLWSGLRLVGDGPAPMFAFQIACYWLGFLLMAFTLSRTGHRYLAWAVLAVGVLPSFVTMNVNILKDVGMAATLLAGFGLAFTYRGRNLPVPLPVACVALLLLLYGMLVRANGVFAFPALAAYLLWPQGFQRPRAMILGCLGAAILLVPASAFINHAILKATPTGQIRVLQVFDLGGIAHFSRDLAVFGEHPAVTLVEVDNCYNPMGVEAMDGYRCTFWQRLAISPDYKITDRTTGDDLVFAAPNPQLRRLWIHAILAHPAAYAWHRIQHFNSELSFLVPTHHAAPNVIDWVASGDPLVLPATSRQQKVVAFFTDNVLMMPAFSFVVGTCLWLMIAGSTVMNPALRPASLTLLSSGLLYTWAYLFVGVASERRYHFWGQIAVFAAAVIASGELKALWGTLGPVKWVCASVVAFTIGAMVGWRLILPDAFVVPG